MSTTCVRCRHEVPGLKLTADAYCSQCWMNPPTPQPYDPKRRQCLSCPPLPAHVTGGAVPYVPVVDPIQPQAVKFVSDMDLFVSFMRTSSSYALCGGRPDTVLPTLTYWKVLLGHLSLDLESLERKASLASTERRKQNSVAKEEPTAAANPPTVVPEGKQSMTSSTQS